jgi:hypothetical protein
VGSPFQCLPACIVLYCTTAPYSFIVVLCHCCVQRDVQSMMWRSSDRNAMQYGSDRASECPPKYCSNSTSPSNQSNPQIRKTPLCHVGFTGLHASTYPAFTHAPTTKMDHRREEWRGGGVNQRLIQLLHSSLEQHATFNMSHLLRAKRRRRCLNVSLNSWAKTPRHLRPRASCARLHHPPARRRRPQSPRMPRQGRSRQAKGPRLGQ